MDFDKTYPKTDDAKAQNGVWQPISKDFEVLVAKSGNKRFMEKSKAVFRPHRVSAQRGALDDDTMSELTCKVMAGTILLNWRGKATFGGEPVGAFSVERAEELLGKYPDFREDIAKLSDDKQAYAEAGLELELGNSSSTSNGSSGGESSSQ